MKAPRRIGVRLSSALVLATSLLLVAACSDGSRQKKPRLVLLYATCTLNKDYLFPYDASVPYTPNLAALSAESVVFERHQTEAGQSGPAFASIFSGSQVDRHRVFSHPSVLPESIELVTEAYAGAGYDVFAWLGHGLASVELGYAQGVPAGQAFSRALVAEDPVFERVLERLEADRDYRVFLLTNFTVTHGPYERSHVPELCDRFPAECKGLPGAARQEELLPLVVRGPDNRALSWDFPNAVKRLGLETRDLRDLAAMNEVAYESNVFRLDRLFGRLVERIGAAGLLEESLISFTADHGEVLYRETAHFKWTHGLQQAPEVLAVPWILYAPGAGLAGARYDAVTRSIDVFPTMAALSGVEVADSVDGEDLAAVLRGEAPKRDLLAFAHSILPGDRSQMPQDSYLRVLFPSRDPELMWVSVRDRDLFFKRIRNEAGDFETRLYDLSRDREEATDLFDGNDESHRRMSEALANYQRYLVSVARAGDQGEELPDARRLELLRSLGYIE